MEIALKIFLFMEKIEYDWIQLKIFLKLKKIIINISHKQSPVKTKNKETNNEECQPQEELLCWCSTNTRWYTSEHTNKKSKLIWGNRVIMWRLNCVETLHQKIGYVWIQNGLVCYFVCEEW